MTDPTLRARLTSVFESVLDVSDFSLDANLKMGDIEAWDSFAQINLMLAIEDEFSFEFDADEIGELISVGKIVDAVGARTSSGIA